MLDERINKEIEFVMISKKRNNLYTESSSSATFPYDLKIFIICTFVAFNLNSGEKKLKPGAVDYLKEQKKQLTTEDRDAPEKIHFLVQTDWIRTFKRKSDKNMKVNKIERII